MEARDGTSECRLRVIVNDTSVVLTNGGEVVTMKC